MKKIAIVAVVLIVLYFIWKKNSAPATPAPATTPPVTVLTDSIPVGTSATDGQLGGGSVNPGGTIGTTGGPIDTMTRG